MSIAMPTDHILASTSGIGLTNRVIGAEDCLFLLAQVNSLRVAPRCNQPAACAPSIPIAIDAPLAEHATF